MAEGGDAAIDAAEFSIRTSRGFPAWLAGVRGSIAFTTYQSGKLFLLGLQASGRLSLVGRSFPRAMGLSLSPDGGRLALATDASIQCFDDIAPSGEADALFAPHQAWITGDIDVHDLGWGADGRPVFVATLFGCIATVSDRHSFRPLWRPPFISKLAAEDRCHLNGMALDEGEPVFATAVSRSDMADGWRDRRSDGGVLVDIESGEIAVAGLSMPHSPRLHDGRLWMLNSGSGEIGTVDLGQGRFDPIALCPGFPRGLAFAGDFAIVGLSLPRGDQGFSGLAIEQVLRERDVDPRCGLAIFDMRSGEMVEWVRLEGLVRELFDVEFLPGMRRPSLISLARGEARQAFSIET